MGKFLKVVGWLIGVLFVLVISLIVLAPMIINPNDHKDRIISEVKQATGRDLTITGDIGLSVFPWIGLELNGVGLSNPPGFKGASFAAVEHAQIRVHLIPLVMEQTLEVDQVQLQGLELNLTKTKSGTTNWDDLLGKQPAEVEKSKTDYSDLDSSGKGLAAYSIGGVAISQAHVVWDDQSTNQHYEIENLSLETGTLTPGKSVEVSFGLDLTSQQPPMQGRLDLTGLAKANPDAQQIILEALKVVLKAHGEGLPKQGIEVKLGGNVYFNGAADTLEMKDLSLNLGDAQLTASILGTQMQSKPMFQGEFELHQFSPKKLLKSLDVQLPVMADADVLEKLKMTASLSASTSFVALKQIALVLDDTHVKGEAEMLNPDQPLYKFSLNADKLDLDRYLPPQPEAGAQAAKRPVPAGREEPLFPVELLRQLNLDGRVDIDSLTVSKAKLQAVQVKITAKQGKVKVEEEIGRFFDGQIKGNMQLDATGKIPNLNLNQQAENVQMGQLLTEMADMKKLDGTGHFNTNLSMQGQTVSQLKRNLNGTVNFKFLDGSVKGINLAKMLREAKARLSGTSVALSPEPEQTDFSEMTGSATIRNGIVDNRDLLAKSPFLRVEGAGKANLVMENMDYDIRAVLVKTPEGQGGRDLEQLVGVPIPVHLEGAWADPKWKIDLAKVLEEEQKAKLKGKVETELEKKIPGIKDKLPGGLKGLF